MVQKYLDIQYLRSLNTPQGRLALSGGSNTITFTNFINVDINGNVGIGTSISPEKLTVSGNIQLDSGVLKFSDGSIQSTAAQTTPAAGLPGQIQFNSSNVFAASSQLNWDNANSRLGIGTTTPISPLQVGTWGLSSTTSWIYDTTETIIDSFYIYEIRSAHYFVQVTDVSNSLFHTSQLMVLQDGTSAFCSEYNVVTSVNPIGIFAAKRINSQVLITFTAFNTSSLHVQVARTSLPT